MDFLSNGGLVGSLVSTAERGVGENGSGLAVGCGYCFLG